MNIDWLWTKNSTSTETESSTGPGFDKNNITSKLPGFLYRSPAGSPLEMLFLSENVLEITGHESDDLTREQSVTYESLIHPEDRNAVHDEITQALESGRSFRIEYRLIDRERNEHWVEQQGEVIAEEQHEKFLQGYVQDITEQKQLHLEDRIIRKAAEFVAKSWDFERTLREILQVICSMCKWEFGEIWFPQFVDSETLTAQVHYNPENGELETFWEGNRTVQSQRGEGLIGRVWETGETEWVESSDGGPAFLESEQAREAGLQTALGIPCKADGKPVAVLVFYRRQKNKKSLMVDLLETVGQQIGPMFQKKELEDELKEQRAFYQNLFVDSPAAILVSDLSEVKSTLDELRSNGVQNLESYLLNHRKKLKKIVGSIHPLDFNQAALNILNIAPEDPAPSSPVPFCNQKTYEAYAAEFSALYEGSQPYQDERPYVTANGDQIIVLNSSSFAEEFKNDWSKVYFTLTDITDQKRFQDKLQESLDERMILLREIHHRVKNNLQVIISLLGLQIRLMDLDPTVENVLQDVRNRIFSMALIHDQVYHLSSYEDINVEEYVTELVAHILGSQAPKTLTVERDFNIDSVSLNVDTLIPLGIIINELVSNALVHGFEDRSTGKLQIDLRSAKKESHELTISDNGRGWQGEDSLEETSSLGSTLVRTLARKQLHGEIDHLETREGVTIRITFEAKSDEKTIVNSFEKESLEND